MSWLGYRRYPDPRRAASWGDAAPVSAGRRPPAPSARPDNAPSPARCADLRGACWRRNARRGTSRATLSSSEMTVISPLLPTRTAALPVLQLRLPEEQSAPETSGKDETNARHRKAVRGRTTDCYGCRVDRQRRPAVFAVMLSPPLLLVGVGVGVWQSAGWKPPALASSRPRSDCSRSTP
jgi:hypothetical protein